jgi:hypothetical protein
MADKYGVVKPADKTEKQAKPEKKIQPKAKDEGIHQPLAADMKKLQSDQQQKRQEEKTAAHKAKADDRKKEAEKKAEKKEQDQFGKIYAYSDEVKKRHPNLPDDLYKKIHSSKTKGEGKKLLREYLQSLPPPVQ